MLWNSAAPGAALLCSWLKPASKWQGPARLAYLAWTVHHWNLDTDHNPPGELLLSVAVITGLGSKAQMLLLWAALLCALSSVGRMWDQVCGKFSLESWTELILSSVCALEWDSMSAAPQLAAKPRGLERPIFAGQPQTSSAPSPHPAVRNWRVPGVCLSGGYQLGWILLQPSYKAVVSECCCWWRIGLTAFLNRHYRALNLYSGHKTGE